MDELSALVAEGEILRTYEHDWNLSLSGMEVRNVTAAVVHPYGGLQGVLAARVLKAGLPERGGAVCTPAQEHRPRQEQS